MPDWKMIFLNGIFAGIIMQVKYLMLGFYFAWMAVMALMHFTPANIRKSTQNCFVFLGGMAVTMVPWLIYFGIYGALDDWYQCYIYNNVFLYSDLNSEGVSVFSKIYDLAKILINLVRDNFSYFAFIVLGMIFLFRRKSKWYEKINVYAMFGFLFLGIYIGGANIFYYSIPLMVFTAMGLAAIGAVIDCIIGRLKITNIGNAANQKSSKHEKSVKGYYGIAIISAIVCLIGSYNLSMNTD